MRAFLYAAALQWRLDIRSKTLLITCYVVPLLFFAFMGSVFTAVNPEMQHTLIPSMSVMGVSMGALIGLPPSIVETYAGDIKKMYTANGVPLCFGLAAMCLSAFAHLTVMCISLYLIAPLLFGAARPASAPAYFGALAVFITVSLSVGCVLGLVNRNQAKSTMFSQIVFLPSILLSGILFPRELLPGVFTAAGRLFPASWGYALMLDGGLRPENLLALCVILLLSMGMSAALLRCRARSG